MPFLSLPPTEPQSWQVGAISKTPSTWLTLFAHLGIYQRLCPTQITAHPQPSYLYLSSSRPDTSSSQLWITIWLCLGTSKPSTSSSHLRLLCSSCSVVLGRTQVVADPERHYPGNPEPAHPVDSYRPCWSTTILP